MEIHPRVGHVSHLKETSLDIAVDIADVYSSEQTYGNLVGHEGNLHVIGQLDADFDSICGDGQRAKGEGDAANAHKTLDIDIDFQGRKIKKGQGIIGELEASKYRP